MLEEFERIVRSASEFTEEAVGDPDHAHPFVQRSIWDGFPPKVRKLFDDNYYSEATFEAFKFIDRKVSKLSGLTETGQKLMMQAFAESGPLKLTPLSNESEINEQNGYKFIFAGAMSAVRNPRGHEFDHNDKLELCLDNLALASSLVRRLQDAGFLLD